MKPTGIGSYFESAQPAGRRDIRGYKEETLHNNSHLTEIWLSEGRASMSAFEAKQTQKWAPEATSTSTWDSKPGLAAL